MKTLNHEAAFPKAGSVEQGLTKREHMAIEFTKAYIAHNLLEPNHPNMTYAVKLGIETADELIKQLNA